MFSLVVFLSYELWRGGEVTLVVFSVCSLALPCALGQSAGKRHLRPSKGKAGWGSSILCGLLQIGALYCFFFNLFLLWLLIIPCNHSYFVGCLAVQSNSVIYGQVNLLTSRNFFLCFCWHSAHSHYAWTLIRCLWNVCLPTSRAINKAAPGRQAPTALQRSSTPIVLRAPKIKSVEQRMKGVWSWRMESTWPAVSAASSWHSCLTAVGHTMHLWRTGFMLEIRKGNLGDSFSTVHSSKPPFI